MKKQSEIKLALRHYRDGIDFADALHLVSAAACDGLMDQGRIVERGTQRELIERNGAYARLHQIQYESRDSVESPARLEIANAPAAADHRPRAGLFCAGNRPRPPLDRIRRPEQGDGTNPRRGGHMRYRGVGADKQLGLPQEIRRLRQ